MRAKWLPLFGIVAVVGLLGVGALPRSPGQEAIAPPRARWEYKEVADDKLADEGGLAKLGDQGWELVHVDPKLPYLTRTNPAGVTSVEYTKRVYYLKRPK
jgi:hypothetical protein